MQTTSPATELRPTVVGHIPGDRSNPRTYLVDWGTPVHEAGWPNLTGLRLARCLAQDNVQVQFSSQLSLEADGVDVPITDKVAIIRRDCTPESLEQELLPKVAAHLEASPRSPVRISYTAGTLPDEFIFHASPGLTNHDVRYIQAARGVQFARRVADPDLPYAFARVIFLPGENPRNAAFKHHLDNMELDLV